MRYAIFCFMVMSLLLYGIFSFALRLRFPQCWPVSHLIIIMCSAYCQQAFRRFFYPRGGRNDSQVSSVRMLSCCM